MYEEEFNAYTKKIRCVSLHGGSGIERMREERTTWVGIVTGMTNLWVSAAGWLGVGVQVGHVIPDTNPYPCHG